MILNYIILVTATFIRTSFMITQYYVTVIIGIRVFFVPGDQGKKRPEL